MTAGLSGRVGRLLVAVRGPAAPGEVELVVDGTRETYIAYGTERVARGDAVLVIHDRGGRSVDVVPWAYPPGPGVDDAGPSER